ncbi:uncharacterized protein [Arachis hypogaea]|uniref:uncharacterized protein n=1 Tax=Arachis hypogaea TaxID=3818 RepID=UPI00078755FF|nr:uncharacterized protein LOC112710938 [Arachis hypogaea]QHO34657.1 uncharacterized protein DS421_9g268790 [Arachis hypogaea]
MLQFIKLESSDPTIRKTVKGCSLLPQVVSLEDWRGLQWFPDLETYSLLNSGRLGGSLAFLYIFQKRIESFESKIIYLKDFIIAWKHHTNKAGMDLSPIKLAKG